MPWFNSNNLSWPDNGDINEWADFLEVICLFSDDHTISLNEFADFLSDDGTKTNKDILKAINFNEHFLSELVSGVVVPLHKPLIATGRTEDGEEDAISDGKNEDEDDEVTNGEDEENLQQEKIRSRLLKLFEFIRTRSASYAEFYPFELNGTHLKLKEAALSDLERMYLVLLFSSEMRIYSPANRNAIGHMFEALCKLPFNQLVPAVAEKRFFGAGGGQFIAASYAGNLREKIIALAAEMHVETIGKYLNDPDEVGRTGDGGLDWVAWMLLEDGCDHHPAYFAQCACGSDWVDKQHETSLERWNNFLHFTNSIQCIHFMPRSFRRLKLEWFRASKIHAEITLIDRFRLLKLFSIESPQDVRAELISYQQLLDEALVFKYASTG